MFEKVERAREVSRSGRSRGAEREEDAGEEGDGVKPLGEVRRAACQREERGRESRWWWLWVRAESQGSSVGV